MPYDYSLEEQIIEGKVQVIRDFRVDFDKIAINFENTVTGQKKTLNFSRVISLSVEAIFGADYEDDMDRMAYRTLLGFGVEKSEKLYIYEMMIDDYVIRIESLNPASLDRIE